MNQGPCLDFGKHNYPQTKRRGRIIPPLDPHRFWTSHAAGVIIFAALVVYHNCFAAPFVFDDIDSITRNPTIRHLWPIWKALSPPEAKGFTVTGRPLVNLSLAINYALGGNAPWGYHAFNLVIHILAGLALFGIVRRTLLAARALRNDSLLRPCRWRSPQPSSGWFIHCRRSP